MKKIKTIIVDDESSNRRLISNLVHKLNINFEVVGEAENINEAFELINFIQPELVLLDVKMPGGNGFELLGMFKEIFFEVVFISGFDTYALKAFEFNALDYVLKPIHPEKFSKTLNKIKNSIEGKNFQQQNLKSILEAYDSKKSIMSKIPIHFGKLVKIINIEEIQSISSEDGCTTFRLNSKEKLTSSKQLCDFEFILESSPFIIRINKSTFVNVNQIVSYSKGVLCDITLKDGTVFEISRRKKGEVLGVLSNMIK